MSVDWTTFELPERVDLAADCGLHGFLLAHRDVPVRVSAARLRRVDGRLVQYLITVARDRTARDVGFAVTDVAPPQAAMLDLIGVTPDLLPWAEGVA